MEIENKPLAIPRRPGNPAWLPGVSGNPGGRPKGIASLVREQTADGADLIDFLVKVVHNKRQPMRLRLEACAQLLDRGFGKPLQQMELSGPGAEPLTIRIEYPEGSVDADADRHT
jgi:hypothetical protein